MIIFSIFSSLPETLEAKLMRPTDEKRQALRTTALLNLYSIPIVKGLSISLVFSLSHGVRCIVAQNRD